MGVRKKKASERVGNTSISVKNTTPRGIWLYVSGKKYFLDYKTFPHFKGLALRSIQDVKLLHGYHLYWPQLDIDLEIDNLANPDKYPLKSVLATKKN